MNYSDILFNVIINRRAENYVGLIINHISNVNLNEVLDKLNSKAIEENVTFYISIVDGKMLSKHYEKIEIAYTIEKAVLWRSEPEYSNNIFVFLENETEKMHSLAEFGVINQRDLSVFLVKNCANESLNEPTKKFWLAIKDNISLFNLAMVRDFCENVDVRNQKEMLDNLWRLGLIKDIKFFETSSNAEERLSKNHIVLQKMASLSDISRRKINFTLTKAKDDKEELRKTYDLINDYFRFHTQEILKQLDMYYVERLLDASKEKTKKAEKNKGEDSKKKEDDIVKSKDLIDSFNDAFVNSADESLKDLQENLESLKEYYDSIENDEDFDSTSPVELKNGEYDSKLFIPSNNEELRRFINKYTSKNIWGGLIKSDELNANSILNDVDSEVTLFDICDQNSSMLSFNGKTIDKIFADLDNDINLKFSVDSGLLKTFEQIKELRSKLQDNLALLIYYPTLLFTGDDNAKKNLVEYIDAWQNLFKTLSENKNNIEEISPITLKYIIRFILSVNNVFVEGKNEYQLKSIMLPLNPLFLWKFYEVYKNIAEGERSEEDNLALKESLNNLPNLITHQFVKLYDDSTGVNVPYCGLVKNYLPYYENNKLKGIDGIDNLVEILERWLAYAPYTKNEIRVGMVDVPVILNCLNEVSKFVDDKKSKIIIDFYYTDRENHYSELTYLSDCDERVTELIEQNRIIFHIYEKQTDEQIRVKIGKHPLHILFFFDQCSYVNDFGQSECQKILSPLVPTYEYKYDKYAQYGDIYPSTNTDSGVIGAYYSFLKQNGFIDGNVSPMTKLGSKGKLDFANSALADHLALWEVVADRTVYNYAPSNAICIGEKMLNKRNLCIYAHEDSRVINDFEKLLRGYSLNPKKNVLIDILKKFAHISSEGLVAIPKINSEPVNNRRKGLIGTVFSAYLYREILHKDSLVASLDSKEAGIWISHFENDNDRADLIGLWFDDSTNVLNIDVLEVKTRDQNPDEDHATQQVIKIRNILKSIFEDEKENIFSTSRREVLKKQLVNECFRGINNTEWQLKWEEIFKNVFTDHPKYKVSISSYIYHIKLSSFDDGYAKYSNTDDSVIMYIITAKDIQDFLFDKKEFDLARFTSVKKCVYKNPQILDVNQMNFDNPFEEEYVFDNYKEDNLSKKIVTLNPNLLKDEAKVDKVSASKYEANKVEITTLGRSFYESCKNRKIKITSDFKNSLENVIVGSRVYRYYFKLERGSKLDTLTNQLDDIGREIKRSGLIISQIENDDRIILDIPRLKVDTVEYKDVMCKIPNTTSPEQLYFPIGQEPDGNNLIVDLAEMPHLLVAGSTGSGKTVFLHSMLCSLLSSHPNPEDLKLIISSAGGEDFVFFDKIPHLMNGKVLNSAKETVDIIKTIVIGEFEKRQEILMSKETVNIKEYNGISEEKLPPIVIVIDEFADISDQLTNKKEREDFFEKIRRIVQIGRKRGIHLVLCTQRPSANLVPGPIKAQLPARIALRVPDSTSSRMIIDETGAQNLQKHGDLIYKSSEGKWRAQGYKITPKEIKEILSKLK